MQKLFPIKESKNKNPQRALGVSDLCYMDCPSSDVLIWFLVLQPKNVGQKHFLTIFAKSASLDYYCNRRKIPILRHCNKRVDIIHLYWQRYQHDLIRNGFAKTFFSLLAPLGASYGLVLIRSKHIVVFTQPMNVKWHNNQVLQ